MYIRDLYRDIEQGIKNFWFYKSVIWNDRWYDHYFLMELLNKKLENMENNWDNSHYVDADKDKDKIAEAKSLLSELVKDNFLDEAMKPMDKEYGELELNLDDSDNTALFLRGGKEETPEQEEDWKKYYADSQKRKEEVKEEFFKIFKDNYEKWWD